MSVDWARVGDVLRLERRSVDVDPSTEYREIGVRSFGKGIFHKDPVSGVDIGTKRVFRIEPDDLVVSNIFAWEGAVARAAVSERGYIGSHRFMTWVPTSNEVAVDFVAQYLLSDSGIAQLRRASPGSAGRNRTLGIGSFESLMIPLPDLDEQRRIAARLDAINGSVRSIGGSGVVALSAVMRDRLVQTASADAPQRPIGENLRLVRRAVTIAPNASYVAIGVRSFGRGLIRYPPMDGSALSKLTYFELPANALVVSNIKAWEGAVTVSEDRDQGRVASSRFLCYLPTSNDVDFRYMCAYLASARGVRALGAASPGSADRNRTLGRQRFDRIMVPIPSPAAQAALLAALAKLDDVTALHFRRERLAAALLPAARNEEFARLTSA